MRFRNDQDYPLDVYPAGRTVPPGGEFDWPGWTRADHGPIPGCTALDDEPAATPPGDGDAAGDDPKDTSASDPAPGKAAAATAPPSPQTPPASPAGGTPPTPSTPAAAAASEETKS